jgi:hypothetical protein
MAGQAVPLVLIPRYTSYVGANTFTTVPLAVSDYEQAHVTFWRGRCPGSFAAVFETSHDALVWTNALGTTTITAVDTSDRWDIPLDRRWFRIRIALGTTSITCWATGLLTRRLEDKKAT